MDRSHGLSLDTTLTLTQASEHNTEDCGDFLTNTTPRLGVWTGLQNFRLAAHISPWSVVRRFGDSNVFKRVVRSRSIVTVGR